LILRLNPGFLFIYQTFGFAAFNETNKFRKENKKMKRIGFSNY
jgi:hypothetical protein